jgi:hypothetical protein
MHKPQYAAPVWTLVSDALRLANIAWLRGAPLPDSAASIAAATAARRGEQV